MNQIPWAQAVPVFVGTIPLLGAVLWNLMDVKSIRNELVQIRIEIAAIKTEIATIRERLATLEERDRLSHPIIRN